MDSAAAIPQASMTGRVRVKLPVISTTLAIAVSGAWAAAANTPPIATTAYSAGGPTAGPNTWWATSAEGHARHRPDEQRRGEHAAGAADRERQAGGEDLADQEQEDQPEHDVAGDHLVHHRIADAVHLGQRQQQQRRARRRRPRGAPIRDGPSTARRRSPPASTGTVLKPSPISPAASAEHRDEQIGGVVGDRQVVRDRR